MLTRLVLTCMICVTHLSLALSVMMRTSSKGKDILAKAGLRNLLDKSTSRAEKFKVLQIFVLRYSIGFLIGCRAALTCSNPRLYPRRCYAAR